VEHSRNKAFKKGQEVIVTSYDLGMNTPGGFGQYIRVPADWVIRLPGPLTLAESMIWGTAGFTAGMCVHKLLKGIEPGHGDILVTGATGGVGSLSVGILSHLGYRVTAVSGKKDTTMLLDVLGATQVIARDDFLAGADRLLLKEKWCGVIDTVGGPILSAAIKSTTRDGMVTCCGNAASPDLPLNVFPFILRGVSLLGIDSQHCPMAHRKTIWEKLAADWKFNEFKTICREINLGQLPRKIEGMLNGNSSGRTLVNLG
jgi:putative YhdH/YhfP family quinone oxidoreductase